MSGKERKKWGAILSKWSPFFSIACIFIGVVLGSVLVYLIQGKFPYEVLTGCLIVTIILTFIEVIKQKRKKDHLPEADERVMQNVSRFFHTHHILP